jgi:glutamine amidotransferase
MSAARVTIIDYGVGNLFSVRRAVEVSGATHVRVSASAEDMTWANRLILPGVGAFEGGMRGLHERGLVELLRQQANLGKPLLGICLGMQLLATTSQEFGVHDGLNLIPGQVELMPHTSTDGSPLKVPYIGWAPLRFERHAEAANGCLRNHIETAAVYLVHSYHVRANDPAHLLATYGYGGNRITAAIGRGNVIGMQFHPEKSGAAGLAIMRGFVGSQNPA